MPSSTAKALSGVFKKVDNTKRLMQGVEALTDLQVMVGVPEDKSSRRDEGITNAELAYIHDKGAPDANIPARPFMEPGIAAVKGQITELLTKAGNVAIRFGGRNQVMSILNQVGIIATRSIKNRITEGIPPPLAPSTIRGRIYRIKGKKRRQKIADARAAGTPWSTQAGVTGIFTPLIITAQLRNAITHVIRNAWGKGVSKK